MNVALLLGGAAERSADAPALVSAEGEVIHTIGSLAGLAARHAGYLAARGLQPGGKVLVLVRDPGAALLPVLAVVWAGGVVMAPPRTASLRTMLRVAARQRPDMVLADTIGSTACLAEPSLRRVLTHHRSVRSGRAIAPVARASDDAALVSWTSGTTGEARPIVRTHGVLAAQHEALAAARPLTEGAVDLVGLPTLALHDLALGISFAFPPGRSDGKGLRRMMRRAHVTSVAGFPGLLDAMTQDAAPGELPGVGLIHVGGAPVEPALIERVARVAPAARTWVTYGMTEAEPISLIEASEYVALVLGRRPGDGWPVGRPEPGIEVRIAPPDGAPDVRAADVRSRRGQTVRHEDQRGRVLLRGARVARDPERTDAEGWLDTGDVGRLDRDGRLWLLGRAACVADGPLYPAEAEESACSVDGVTGAALLRLSAAQGADTVLVIETVADGTAARRASSAVERLVAENDWAIDRVAAVDRLPRERRSGAKLDYAELRRLVGRSPAPAPR